MTNTHIHKSKLHCQRLWSVALRGVIFSKLTSNVRRRLDAQSVPPISRNKQNSAAPAWCVCVCDFHTRRPQSSHQHKQRCEGSKQSGQEVCRHSFSVSFLSHDLMHCLHPIMHQPPHIYSEWFRFRTQFLYQFTIFLYFFFYCTKSKQNSPKTD